MGSYRFSYDDDGRDMEYSFTPNEVETASEVLEHFCNFLTAAYGWDVGKDVEFRGGPLGKYIKPISFFMGKPDAWNEEE